MGVQRTRRRAVFVLALVTLLLGSLAGTAGAAVSGEETLVPIGGGYTTTSLQEYAQIVIDHASGNSVDILVDPSSYGNDPDDLVENTALAEDRADQIEAACDAVVSTTEFPGGCTATLLHLFMRSQTEGPEGVAAVTLLQSSETDGVYILGGDQGIAMEVLANSAVENAMATAYAAGVVYGGTSAGAAVQSVDMINGYTDPGYPENALEKDKVVVWWANDQTGPNDFTRGLSFSSENAITDQHFFQRGRFGRLLNVIAQSDERYGGDSKVGIGVDYATGAQITDDTTVHNVFGDSSAAIIDGESLYATFDWVGPNDTLSARNIVTHIVAPDPALSYDMTTREMSDASGVLSIAPGALMSPDLVSRRYCGAVILGGDLSMDWDGPAVEDVVGRIQATRRPTVIVVAVGATSADGRALAQEYVSGLRGAGLRWQQFQTLVYDQSTARFLGMMSFNRAAAVVLVGDDQSSMATAVSDRRFSQMVDRAVASVPVVVADQAMTPVMGDFYATNADPDSDNYQEVGIAAFQAGNVTIAPGLGVVHGAFQGQNTYWQHWGRLYSLSMHSPDTMVYGISELTSIVVDRHGASVVGERSVIMLDGSQASFSVGTNGAFSALNVVLDAYAPGDIIQ